MFPLTAPRRFQAPALCVHTLAHLHTLTRTHSAFFRLFVSAFCAMYSKLTTPPASHAHTKCTHTHTHTHGQTYILLFKPNITSRGNAQHCLHVCVNVFMCGVCVCLCLLLPCLYFATHNVFLHPLLQFPQQQQQQSSYSNRDSRFQFPTMPQVD